MRSITAVEIGADICALARTSVSRGDVQLFAAETLDPGAFPGLDAFTTAVRQTRRRLKLPRRCRAVVWGLPDGARRKDPTVAPLIEPLVKAGFKVVRVVTPCNALGALSRLRVSPSGGAKCWLGINRNGVAIVVIRPGKLLYSHSFAWDSNVGASGSQARLLQRYSLVAFLAPEVRRALAAARQKGTTVDGIVTCGNLPDLRSLTMPLIEELDIEVETLDSLEGLLAHPVDADRLAEIAPSIRLACAGTIARETRTVDENERRRVRRATRAAAVLRVAALVGLLVGAAWWYYWRLHSVRPATPVPPGAKSAAAAPKTNPVSAPASTPQRPASQQPAPAGATNQPVVPPSASGPPSSAPRAPEGRPSAPKETLSSTPSRADKPGATRTPPVAASARAESNATRAERKAPANPRPPELLTDPVPRVTAILIAADRRLATVGDEGQIIRVGDTIGSRVVVEIADKTVVFREPSGVRIRVAIGGRVVGVERIDR